VIQTKPGKGFSQMDWMRLTKQNANLNGLAGGPLREDITMAEVREHRTKDDAWMVFNGLVGVSPACTRPAWVCPATFFSGPPRTSTTLTL